MRYRISLAVMGSFLAIATVAKADQIGALLTGYEESPSVSTTARGEFTATIDGEVILYTETFSGLQGTVTQSHIHVGQLSVNGSVVIFLCQTAANPEALSQSCLFGAKSQNCSLKNQGLTRLNFPIFGDLRQSRN